MFPVGDENRPVIRPYVNYLLLGINVFVFFFLFFGGELEWALWNFGVIPSHILEGERLWTLLTSIFMHADPLHLLGNMLYLWVFGDNIESALGHGRYLLFYMIGGILASFTHILSNLITIPTVGYIGVDIPSVGASGAISAILGAYVLLFPRARIRTLIIRFFVTIVNVPAVFYLGFWFVYQLMMGVISITGLPSAIAFWAHIGGFVYGLLIVKIINVQPRSLPRPMPRRVIRMRRCPYCSYENHPAAYYCASCGSRIR